MIDMVFSLLKVRVAIKVNNRKILTGIAEMIGEADKIVDITVAIDKIDKIGIENVNAELKEKSLDDAALQKLRPLLEMCGSNEDKLKILEETLSSSET